MTNHPQRKRDDNAPASGRAMPGRPPAPAQTPNGDHPPRPDAAKLIGQAVAESLGQHLPQMLFQALAAALQQVTQQHFCATCIISRVMWENSHRADMEKALAAAAQAAGAEPGSPQAGQQDLTPFLPPALRPGERNGIPAVGQAVTTSQGTDLCAAHLAQAAGIQPGRSQLLVATATMNPAMLGQLAGTR